MSFLDNGFSIVGRLSVILILLGAFFFGLGGTLFMALRSPEVQVPQVVGKDKLEGEKELEAMGLKIRQRATRFSQEKPNTILEQSPLAGENVKAGQTIAVVVSRAQAEGDEKPAEVKKETVNDNTNTGTEEVSEVEKSRQKRKAANANKNINANVNKNKNANANTNSHVNAATNSNGSTGESNTSNSNSGGANSNARTNSNTGGNANNRPANTSPGTRSTPAANRNANTSARPSATRSNP